jgi:UDP-N-acetylmuramate dehydrogenase
MADPELTARLRDRVAGTVLTDAPLAGFTTFRVGGPADILVEAERDEDLVAVAELTAGEAPVAIVGRGSNLLVSDAGFRGVAVRLGRGFRTHERTEKGLTLGGAVYMPAAAKLTGRLGLTGLEFAAEIPATFGGAVRMNAGAHQRTMADVLLWVETVDLIGAGRRRLNPADLGLGYRRSGLAPAEVVARGEVQLQQGDPRAIGARIADLIRWRRENQPGGRSAGSVFKNPPGDSAGRLIEAAGGKGTSSGGATVSPVHANFIVAAAGATAGDVWRLIGTVQQLVLEKAGVRLEPEIRFLGDFPHVDQRLEAEVES